MPSSTISLDTLSSPSPSPSPPPPDTHTSTSNQSGGGAGLDSGSELSELTDDEQENDKGKTAREERARPPRRGRKRGGIVPAPMWDWAYKNNKKEPAKPKPEEEEEEEQAGPVKAMEEEEDDELDQRSQSGASSLPDRRGRRNNVKGASPDEDDGLDVAHGPTTAAASRDINPNDPDYLSDEEDIDDAADGGDDETHHPDDGGAASQDVTDDENVEDEDGVAPPEEDHLDEDEDADENAGAESEDETEVPSSIPVSTAPPTTTASRQPVETPAEPDPGLEKMEVDTATPGVAQRSPIIAAAAASSIMAGSSVIRAPSPTPSASSAEGSTRKRTPADSRSPTPEVPSDHEKRAPARSRTRARNGRSTRPRTRRKPKAEPIVEPVTETDHAQLDDQDPDGDDVDLDNAELEMESELQPAHRAEALDVLATIELKYALLRERLYVEKMENLAWEEALVLQGVHPEMTHLHEELSKRRDKRLELAARRRDYEVVNLTKRRRLDEDAVWSWWKYRRDELQTTMIAETNRKRRKLDRERRALDRPLPVRRIPSPPIDIPVASSLRELVKGNPFDSADARRRQLPLSSLAYPNLTMLSQTDIINDLEFLNGHRRVYDSLRPGTMGVGFPGGGPNGYEQFNMGVGLMDGPGLPNRLPPQPPFQQAPFQHAPPPNQMMPGYPGPGAASAPRLQHHHSAPPGNMPNLVHSQMLIEQDVGLIRRPGSGAPNANQFSGGPPLPLMRRSISPVPLQPRGTPNASGSAALGNKANGWMGMGGSSLSGSSKEPTRHPSALRPMDMDNIDREKDRDRVSDTLKTRDRSEWEWDPERERDMERDNLKERDRDRDREQDRDLEGLNQAPQLLQRQQHTHPLISPGQALNHHHRHHHHHVHHHHHPNASTSPTVLPSQSLNGASVDRTSPLLPRELESRRPLGEAPMEGIESSSMVKSILTSPMSSLWKASDEPSLSSDLARERARSALAPAAQERITTPFVLTPSQAMAIQRNPSPSSRNVQGPSTAPTSISPSRRGSWSAADDVGMPRPLSSGSTHVVNNASSTPSHLHPSAGLAGKRLQSSPSMTPQGPALTASPHSNGVIRLPPLSPAPAPGTRSPVRVPQTLSPLSSAASKPLSPKTLRRSPPPSRPKSPGRERIGTPVNGPNPGPAVAKVRPASPGPMFPASPSLAAPLSTSRLPSVSSNSDPNIPPVPQSVPS